MSNYGSGSPKKKVTFNLNTFPFSVNMDKEDITYDNGVKRSN